MSHTPNELHDLFQDKSDKIHTLREKDAHFRHIGDRYHALNREIHRGETDVEPMDDFHLEDLKKQRLQLLDEIKTYLN